MGKIEQEIQDEIKDIEEEFSSSRNRTHMLASKVLSKKEYLNFLRSVFLEKIKREEKLRERRRLDSQRSRQISGDSVSSVGSCGDGGC